MRVSFAILITILITSLGFVSCNNGSQGNNRRSNDTGAIALQVDWPDKPASTRKHQVKAAVDCSAMNVTEISAQVFSGTHDPIITGGPWRCDAGSGKISNVPAEDDLLVRLHAFDADGEEVYRGEALNVSVESNTTTHVDIRMENVIKRQISMVQDINPGPGGSFPHRLSELQNQLCFVALDVDSGFEFFIANADGKSAQLVRDIYPDDDLDRIGVMAPTGFVELNGWLYFCAYGNGGYRIWRTQGTAASTELADADADYFNPTELTVLGDKLFFSAENAGSGRELWVFEETSGQARQVYDIQSGQAGSNPNNLTVVGDDLFFAADDGVNGCELWLTYGNATSCQLVADLRSGSQQGSYPIHLTAAADDRLFFAAYNGPQAPNADPPTYAEELWMLWRGTDGFEYQLVTDINSTANDEGGSSKPRNLIWLTGTRLAFSAYTPDTGRELYLYDWQSDTAPQRITDLNPSGAASFPANFVYLAGTLYFSASSGNNIDHMWAYSLETQTLVCLTEDLLHPNPRDLTAVNQTLYFTASHQSFGRCLWATDGNRVNLIVNTHDDDTQHSPSNLFAASSGGLYYSAFNADSGEELFLLGDE